MQSASGDNKGGVVEDAPQQIDLDPGMLVEKLDSWIDGAVRLIPNIITAILVLIVFYFLARFLGRIVRKSAVKRSRDNLGEVLGGLVKWMLMIIGFLFAATIVIPTLKPADLIAGLGVSSVAIGFAFKDILQNWLAGLLILLRQPFEIDDQIEVNGFEGTVKRIETRATIIKTYDGQRIVIPNSDIYTNSVLVKTAHEFRRSQYDIGIGYGDGIDDACSIILDAVKSVDEIVTEPAPEALPWDLAASWVTIRARWWTDSSRSDVVHVHSKVIKAVKTALDDAGIDMPYETYQQLLHDQTDTFDGDRTKQREGWPAEKDKDLKPRWKAQLEAEKSSENKQ
ncbi:mechanosensitive ion channel family protein [Aliiglaciecola litoralis]|uniref:Small-conductance mechanosensitive channel n=1 Tax=Aliiglaciecola litoralis TaxID=582857 RepID=A0ABP3WTM8_9ALTE